MAPRRSRAIVAWAAPICLAIGCSSITEFTPEGSTGEAPASGSTTTGLLPPGAGTSTTAAGDDSSSGSTGFEPQGEDSGCPFICDPGDVPPIFECDIWDDDCPRGEKCTYWANDGGVTLNSTRCVPVAADPAGPGEPCTAEAMGFDDCAAGSMCWEFARYPEGFCVPFCVGSPEDPSCEDAGRVCTVTGGGVAFCRAGCNPLDVESCPEGSGCYPGEGLFCLPDASGEGGGVFERCKFKNACDPGLHCATADTVGACEAGDPFCCTPFCDLQTPECPGGTVCAPFYDQDAPPGYESLGFCGAP